MPDTIYYGNSLKDWIICLSVVIAAFIACKILVLLNNYIIKRIADSRKYPFEGICLKSIERPVLLGVMLFSTCLALKCLNMESEMRLIVDTSCNLLTILDATWFVARLITSLVEEGIVLSRYREDGKMFDAKLLPLIKRCLNVIVWLIGIVMALNNAGVKVSTLLGTLGIGGLAFALAAQDTIKNIFGGITIFIDRTFKIGDIINVNGVEGTVEDIGIRSTRIRTYDRQIVIIPNYKLTDALITNISREHARRVVATLGLTYDTDYNKMKQALELLKKIPETVRDVHKRDLYATFSEFGDSALVITFIYFIRKTADIRETVSVVNFEILRAFGEAGLNFAFPTQTIFLENSKAQSAK
ncbi:MAG: mechanosensitive ion channel family protein [Tannerella sp.]|jgi:MscS family membrane protein|nr:mechanosensitive ion channel family protein [Tannerella sp.]